MYRFYPPERRSKDFAEGASGDPSTTGEVKTALSQFKCYGTPAGNYESDVTTQPSFLSNRSTLQILFSKCYKKMVHSAERTIFIIPSHVPKDCYLSFELQAFQVHSDSLEFHLLKPLTLTLR